MQILHVHILDDNADELLLLTRVVTKLGFPAICHSDCDTFVDQISDHSAGCLILEPQMAGGRGFDLLNMLAKRTTVPPIIISTRHANVPNVVRAYQIARPIAFLERQTMSEIALLEAIQEAMARVEEQQAAIARREELETRLQQLTQPETDVLDLLLQGADHTKISTDLAISRRTVEHRRANIMKKIGASTFPNLVRIVLDAGYRIRP